MSKIQFDSIQVNVVDLLICGKVFDDNFSLVSFVIEGIESLIKKFKLKIPPADCQLVINEGSGRTTVMNHNDVIEDYNAMLLSDSKCCCSKRYKRGKNRISHSVYRAELHEVCVPWVQSSLHLCYDNQI
ncbi:hypothetical protein RRG08_039017 [Elysia crispata]|uniref:Uncharacterized protein n=1 Tax=Elysia crispata TaxID=231223 RepID=A0AAE1E4S7_9GAST|nr:hypothetical protein RRG08_039017 [Elysia crispata]